MLAKSRGSKDRLTARNDEEADVALLKLDANGNKLSSEIFGVPDYDRPWQVIATTDGGFPVTGVDASDGGDFTGNYGCGDVFIMKEAAIGLSLYSHFPGLQCFAIY